MLMIVAGSFGIAGAMFSVSAGTSEQVSNVVTYTTAVTKTVERINPETGQYEIIEQETVHNNLTDAGRQMIINFLTGKTAQLNNISMIAISNSSINADIALGGLSQMNDCGLRNTTAIINPTNATARDISWQWTSSCDAQLINTTAIYNGTALGNVTATSVMFARAALTPSTLQNTDKIQVNYTINIG